MSRWTKVGFVADWDNEEGVRDGWLDLDAVIWYRPSWPMRDGKEVPVTEIGMQGAIRIFLAISYDDFHYMIHTTSEGKDA